MRHRRRPPCTLLSFPPLPHRPRSSLAPPAPTPTPLSLSLSLSAVVILNDQASLGELDDIIRSQKIECIVVSPGPGTPASCRDAGVNLDVFTRYTDVPILGVCFGFQCLCQVHGGASVVRAPEPVHGRTSAVCHDGDPLFRGIPSGRAYDVVRYHSLCVDPATLDSETVIPLAWTCDGDAGDAGDHRSVGPRVMMAAKHVKYPHYGVQFHPESICTTFGHALLANFRDLAAAWNAARAPESARRPSSRTPDDLASTSSAAFSGPTASAHGPAIGGNSVASRTVDPAVNTRASPAAPGRLGVALEKLEGCLKGIQGGTARMVDELFAKGGTRDVFFLDSATTERTRFSYMGGVGGPLWRRVSYVIRDDIKSDGNNDRNRNMNLDRDEARDEKTGGSGGWLTVVDRAGRETGAECSSIFDWLTEQTAAFATFDDDLSSLPFDFWGGPLGYLGYELKCQTGGRRAHRSENCDACFFVVDRFICVDHDNGDVYVVAVFDRSARGVDGGGGGHNGDDNDDDDDDDDDNDNRAHRGDPYGGENHRAWVADVAAACRRMGGGVQSHGEELYEDAASTANAPVTPTAGRLPPLSDFSERHPQAAYMSMVERCQASLFAGDSYELCLTNMLRSPRRPGDAEPWDVYKRLRNRNPAPYAAFLDFSAATTPGAPTTTARSPSPKTPACGSTLPSTLPSTSPPTSSALPSKIPSNAPARGPILCCSSPERFLRGTRTGALEAKPIKGTARRHPDDPERDAIAAQQLLESEKDRAENLMIVDLLRNDLGRVAETGSVRVPGLMRLESFATVHQMVSTIVAQKKESIGTGEVIRAAFPGGSMTGAPKIRSMEILDAIEGGPRGVYSGSIGYISWNGAFDLNIVIRTAIFNDGEVLVGAGGAIVVQSCPQGEYEEMKLKFETLRVV